MSDLYELIGNIIYAFQAVIALWAAYCVVIVLYRVSQKRFRSEDEQDEFLFALCEPLHEGDFETAGQVLEGDQRAMCQLALMGIKNRSLGFKKVRQLVAERFQRDVLTDLDYRLSWVHTMIKSAPMVGLLGTVVGMMGAFGQLAAQENVNPTELAGNISLALITTCIGLVTAIPLIVCVNLINIRIRRMEDLTAAGLNHFLEMLRPVVPESAEQPRPMAAVGR